MIREELFSEEEWKELNVLYESLQALRVSVAELDVDYRRVEDKVNRLEADWAVLERNANIVAQHCCDVALGLRACDRERVITGKDGGCGRASTGGASEVVSSGQEANFGTCGNAVESTTVGGGSSEGVGEGSE